VSDFDANAVTKSNTAKAEPLVETKSTLANLNLIIQMARNQMPLLLEGGTGVGKSATISEAAIRSGSTLVRFNLSSRIGVDDLIGRTTIKSDGSIEYKEQPFTVAYEKGHWLLLDELNLAPDPVLQATALPSSVPAVLIRLPCSVSSPRWRRGSLPSLVPAAIARLPEVSRCTRSSACSARRIQTPACSRASAKSFRHRSSTASAAWCSSR
jgi:hypothetical protein